jgi:hypothetical protein
VGGARGAEPSGKLYDDDDAREVDWHGGEEDGVTRSPVMH